jgi:hypothetical protein
MDEKVERAPLLRDRGKRSIDRRRLLDIARQQQRSAHGFRQRPHAAAERLALIGKSKRCALSSERAGNAPSDRVIVGNAHDQPALALHQLRHGAPIHRATVPSREGPDEFSNLKHRAA